MKLRLTLIIAAVMASGTFLYAQSDTSKLAYNLHLGSMDYSGDYGRRYYSLTHGFAGGVGVSYYLMPSFDVQADLNFGHVRGDNAGPNRNTGIDTVFNFKANMGNLNINLKYKFTNGYILKESCKWSPYIVGGIGGIYSVSKGLSHLGNFTNLKVLTFNFNLGVGLKYQLNPNVGLYIQSMQLMPLSDKFDGWYLKIPANKHNDVFLMSCIGIIINPGVYTSKQDKPAKEEKPKKERK